MAESSLKVSWPCSIDVMNINPTTLRVRSINLPAYEETKAQQAGTPRYDIEQPDLVAHVLNTVLLAGLLGGLSRLSYPASLRVSLSPEGAWRSTSTSRVPAAQLSCHHHLSGAQAYEQCVEEPQPRATGARAVTVGPG